MKVNEERYEKAKSQMTKQNWIDMEICAVFVAKMIRKYGKEVLDEIEAEREKSKK